MDATYNLENELISIIRKGQELSTANYPDYLKSQSWKRARNLALSKANGRCQVCNSAENLNVHHRTYNLGNEKLSDLTVLCRKCHEQFHKNKKVGYEDLDYE